MITVVTWQWGGLFSPLYVARLRAGLGRHLRIPHELVVVSDNPRGLEGLGVRAVPMPSRFVRTPRCRRRMEQFSKEFAAKIGASRILALDLDLVFVRDLTPLVDRPERVLGYRVPHAGVVSGSFLLFDAGALHEAWLPFKVDPIGYPARVQPRGVPSDQAMLNFYLEGRRSRGLAPLETLWDERDGFVTYYGAGYERFEHMGIGPNTGEQLPANARVVILGSDDKAVMDEARFSWVREHWID